MPSLRSAAVSVGLRPRAGDPAARERPAAAAEASPLPRLPHVLLPPFSLLQRADIVHTIAAALLDHVAGQGPPRVAERLFQPAATVHGSLRRAPTRAAFRHRHGVIYAYLLTPAPSR